MKLFPRILLFAGLVLGMSQVSAQQVTPIQKSKAQIQLEQMLTNLKSNGLPKSRPLADVITESDPRFKTLNELHPSFRKHLDPQFRPAKNAKVIPIAERPVSAAERKRNSQLQAIIKRRQ